MSDPNTQSELLELFRTRVNRAEKLALHFRTRMREYRPDALAYRDLCTVLLLKEGQNPLHHYIYPMQERLRRLDEENSNLRMEYATAMHCAAATESQNQAIKANLPKSWDELSVQQLCEVRDRLVSVLAQRVLGDQRKGLTMQQSAAIYIPATRQQE